MQPNHSPPSHSGDGRTPALTDKCSSSLLYLFFNKQKPYGQVLRMDNETFHPGGPGIPLEEGDESALRGNGDFCLRVLLHLLQVAPFLANETPNKVIMGQDLQGNLVSPWEEVRDKSSLDGRPLQMGVSRTNARTKSCFQTKP